MNKEIVIKVMAAIAVALVIILAVMLVAPSAASKKREERNEELLELASKSGVLAIEVAEAKEKYEEAELAYFSKGRELEEAQKKIVELQNKFIKNKGKIEPPDELKKKPSPSPVITQK